MRWRDGFHRHSGAGGFGECCAGLEDGQADFEGGAAFGTVVAGDLSFVVLDHSVSRAESQARAFADRLGGVERIEYALGFA